MIGTCTKNTKKIDDYFNIDDSLYYHAHIKNKTINYILFVDKIKGKKLIN